MENRLFKLVSFVIFILASSSVNSQNTKRESPPRVETNEILSEITEATGWHKNAAGEWCQHPQKIDDCHTGPYGEFTKLQLRRVSTPHGDMVALTKTFKSFRYLYPTLQLSPLAIEPTNYGVFEIEELRNLLRKENKPYVARFNVKYWGQVEGDEILRREVAEWINNPKLLKPSRLGIGGLTLWPVVIDGVNLMRFDTNVCWYDEWKDEGCKVLDAYSFEKNYYEVPYEIFENFIESALAKLDGPDRNEKSMAD